MIDFNTFETFEGEKPYLLLDQHPDGNYLAMQIATTDVFLAAIWNTETRRLAWFPEEAYGLAWLRQGTQIAAFQNTNPWLSDDFLFSTYSWPQGFLLQQCPLRFPLGYMFDLFISPSNDLAVCRWTDQCEFGFEFVTLTDQGVIQLGQQGYMNRKTNYSTRPVFRPDGLFWICCYQDNTSWWADEDTLESYNKPGKGGKREIGAAMVFQGTNYLGEIPLIVTVAAGYLPPGIRTIEGIPHDMVYVSDPVFLDADHIIVRLPSGESQIHDLSRFWK
jgi:hypothetical protein